LLLCECHSKDSENVVIGGLDIYFGLDKTDPFLKELTPLVFCEFKSVKVQPALVVVHAGLGDPKLQVRGSGQVLEAVWLWLFIQVTTPDGANSIIKSIFDVYTLCRFVGRNPAVVAHFDCRRNFGHLQFEPLLLFEGICFLLFFLLSLSWKGVYFFQ